MAVGIFWGDFEHNDPPDFLYKLEMAIPLEMEVTEDMILHIFEIHLKSHSYADLWWSALPATQKDTWEHLCDAFEKEWPRNGINPRPTLQHIPEPSPSVFPTEPSLPIPSSQPTSHASTATSQPSSATSTTTTTTSTTPTTSKHSVATPPCIPVPPSSSTTPLDASQPPLEPPRSHTTRATSLTTVAPSSPEIVEYPPSAATPKPQRPTSTPPRPSAAPQPPVEPPLLSTTAATSLLTTPAPPTKTVENQPSGAQMTRVPPTYTPSRALATPEPPPAPSLPSSTTPPPPLTTPSTAPPPQTPMTPGQLPIPPEPRTKPPRPPDPPPNPRYARRHPTRTSTTAVFPGSAPLRTTNHGSRTTNHAGQPT